MIRPPPKKSLRMWKHKCKEKSMCAYSFIQQIPISTEFLEHFKRTMWLRQPFHSHSLFQQKIQPVKDASCYGHTISDLSLHNKATLTFLNRRWLYTLTFVFTEQTKIAYYIWGIRMYKYYKHRHKFIKIMEKNAKYHRQHWNKSNLGGNSPNTHFRREFRFIFAS